MVEYGWHPQLEGQRVIKFFKEQQEEKKELQMWKKAYPKADFRIQMFMGRNALIMPVLPPCQNNNNEQVKKEVKQM